MQTDNQTGTDGANRPPGHTLAHRDRILGLLRECGPAGATNRELNEIGFRYGARLWELRKQGFSIQTIREGEGLFRFVLLAEPNHLALLPSYSRRRAAAEQAPLFAEVAR